MSRVISLAEVAKHTKEEDCWVVVNGGVYDVTNFLSDHPGGKKILLRQGGKDASKQFRQFHALSVLERYSNLRIGTVGSSGTDEAKSAVVTPAADATSVEWSKIPYADPAYLQEWKSPYFKESHYRLRRKMRAFVSEHITPYCAEWDKAKKIPKEVYKQVAGWASMGVGPPWPKKYLGDSIWDGVITADEFDSFHEFVVVDEVARCGSGGVVWGLFEGLSLGLPPVYHYGPEWMKKTVVPQVLSGEKIICLAITEPGAGSDVANIQTTAKKTPDGKYYIVNGEKKWITNGIFSDYFSTAVRTGAAGMGGISMVLIHKDMPGVKTRQMDCMGMWASGTTYVTFEDVKVPVENLIGEEGGGFKVVMNNFNHERWWLTIQSTRFARVCLEEAFTYACKRKTFGKRLIDHPVIRWKIAEMIRQVESTQAWLDSITYQMTVLPHDQANKILAGPIALVKVQSTKTMEYCAREAAQVFGGLSYTSGGQGERVERLYREVRGYAIPGGSEEILLDLGVRQAMRRAKL